MHGSYTITNKDIKQHVEQYKELIINLRDEKYQANEFLNIEYANELTNKHV